MQKISYLYHFDKQIDLKDRNLIITGKNGSGKTRFLSELENLLVNDQTKKIVEIKNKRIKLIELIKYGLDSFPLSLNMNTENIKNFNNLRYKSLSENEFKKILIDLNLALSKSLLQFNRNKNKYFSNTANKQIQQHIEASSPDLIKEDFFYFHNPEHIYSFINKAKSLIENYIFSNEHVSFIPEYSNRNDIYVFEASRVKSNRFTLKVFQSYENLRKNNKKIDIEETFEAFIISQKKEFEKFTYLAEKYKIEEYLKTDLFLKSKMERWFMKVTNDLKYLLENNTTRLSFTKNSDQVLIVQNINNETISFTFDSLSSGFRAVFNIYANLLMRAEINNLEPGDLMGIAIIDEIDVHLHISLQKKVLPFLTKAFPKIQFIVSTHSPFVITSTNDDTVIYDISSGEFFEEDLSLYSHESIIKELFHVRDEDDNLKALSDQLLHFIELENTPKDLESIQNLLNKINKDFEKLSVELQLQYIVAKNKLAKLKHEDN